MGQRSQLIVKIPALYYNAGNVNNKPKRIKVYHNQWLYGSHFIQYLAKLLKTIQYFSKQPIRHFIVTDYEKIVDDAIKYCNNSDKDYLTNTHDYWYDGKEHNYNKDLKKNKSVLDFLTLTYWDNNNGYMYISIDEKGNLKYCILNGYEDNDEIKIRTPKEYVNLFYSDKKIVENCDYELLKALQILKEFKTIDIFKELEDFRKSLKVKKVVV